MDADIPQSEAFWRLARLFQADVIEVCKSAEDMVARARHLDAADQKELTAYLRFLIAAGISDQQLLELWARQPAGIYFYDGAGLRKLLELILSDLEQV